MNSPVLDCMTWCVRGPLHEGRYHATRPVSTALRSSGERSLESTCGKGFHLACLTTRKTGLRR